MTPAAPFQIVIADDHSLFRDGLRTLLQSESQFAVVGEAGDALTAVDAVRTHLHANGFAMVEVSGAQRFAASRTDVDSPWVNWTADSILKTTGKAPAILPNFGGSLPNDVFAEGLGLPTIWVPHSYPGCSQHAPDEHILLPVTEEALAIMAGIFWDLGEMKRAF